MNTFLRAIGHVPSLGNTLVKQAHILRNEQKFEEAAEKYQEAAKLFQQYNCDYEFVENLNLAAKCYSAIGDNLRAAAMYEQTIPKSTEFSKPNVENKIAELYILSGQDDKAIEWLKEAIQKFRFNECDASANIAENKLATCYIRTQQYKLAEEVLNKTLQYMCTEPLLQFSISRVAFKALLCRWLTSTGTLGELHQIYSQKYLPYTQSVENKYLRLLLELETAQEKQAVLEEYRLHYVGGQVDTITLLDKIQSQLQQIQPSLA